MWEGPQWAVPPIGRWYRKTNWESNEEQSSKQHSSMASVLGLSPGCCLECLLWPLGWCILSCQMKQTLSSPSFFFHAIYQCLANNGKQTHTASHGHCQGSRARRQKSGYYIWYWRNCQRYHQERVCRVTKREINWWKKASKTFLSDIIKNRVKEKSLF